MDLGSPLSDISPGVRGALLRELCRLERPVTRRELAAAAGVAPGHASSVIEDLIAAGLVGQTRAGRASLVALNRDHLAARQLIALASLRGELVQRLRALIAANRRVEAAWLFGSVARGDASRTSDIDVVLITDDPTSDDWHRFLTVLHTEIYRATGNSLQVVEHTPEGWSRLVADQNPLVTEVRRDGIALTADQHTPAEAAL
jgi:predicted nucleotidyltransferase